MKLASQGTDSLPPTKFSQAQAPKDRRSEAHASQANAAPAGDGGRLLLYIHVPVYRDPQGGLRIEPQAANGLRLWAENFAAVTVMQPLDPGPAPKDALPVSAIPGTESGRIAFEPLPMAYRPDRFLRALPATRRRIRNLIGAADYLCFSLGGLFGDWGAVAALSAERMGRPFAVWTDRVESELTRYLARHGRGKAAWRAKLTWRAMARLEQRVISQAGLGLFHGRETYDSYGPLCRHPALVHNIHMSAADHIPADALARKRLDCAGGPLRIVYSGRMHEMKGPADWVDALGSLARRGVDFRATWLGDGDLLEETRARVQAAGLSDRVELPGYVGDRGTVLGALRAAHVMLFCHKTPESPRCLIEALASGTPIVGYTGAFAADLISEHGGGRLVAMNDVEGLAATLADLDRDRTGLAELIGRAAKDGAPLHDAAVFAHRAELIREHLPHETDSITLRQPAP